MVIEHRTVIFWIYTMDLWNSRPRPRPNPRTANSRPGQIWTFPAPAKSYPRSFTGFSICGIRETDITLSVSIVDPEKFNVARMAYWDQKLDNFRVMPTFTARALDRSLALDYWIFNIFDLVVHRFLELWTIHI